MCVCRLETYSRRGDHLCNLLLFTTLVQFGSDSVLSLTHPRLETDVVFVLAYS